MAAAQQFFKQAVAVVGHVPDQITTDGHASCPRAIRETMGNHGEHRTNKYLNNHLEQDHRGIRTTLLSNARMREPLKEQHASVALRDELRNYLRPCHTMGEAASLPEKRQAFLQRLAALQAMIPTAS